MPMRLRARFANCADGIPFARALPEVAVRDPIIKSSADLPQELRDILDKTDVGHLTPPEQTDGGHSDVRRLLQKRIKNRYAGHEENAR